MSSWVIAFPPRGKCLLILWLQLLSMVIWSPRKCNHCFHCFPIYLPRVMGLDAMILVFWMFSFKPVLHSPLSPSSKDSLVPLLFLPLEWCHLHIRLLMFVPAVLIPACESTSPTFHMMYSAYKLNKQGDYIQPWCTPFPILNQSIIQCPFLTVASWAAYRFLRRQVRRSDIPISLRIFHIFFVIHRVKGFSVVNQAGLDVFLNSPAFSGIQWMLAINGNFNVITNTSQGSVYFLSPHNAS